MKDKGSKPGILGCFIENFNSNCNLKTQNLWEMEQCRHIVS